MNGMTIKELADGFTITLSWRSRDEYHGGLERDLSV